MQVMGQGKGGQGAAMMSLAPDMVIMPVSFAFNSQKMGSEFCQTKLQVTPARKKCCHQLLSTCTKDISYPGSKMNIAVTGRDIHRKKKEE